MPYIRAHSALTIDYADADGMYKALSIGRDWRAIDVAEAERLRGFTPDVGSGCGWDLEDRFELLPELGGIAPLASCTLAHMALTGSGSYAWRVNSGSWRVGENAGRFRTRWLHFYDGSIDATGRVTSTTALGPNLMLWLWRLGAHPGTSIAPLVQVRLNGAGPDGETYVIGLPGQRQTDTGDDQIATPQPYLMGSADGNVTWEVISIYEASASPRLSASGMADSLEALRIEWIGDALVIRFAGAERPWVVRGLWPDRETPVDIDNCTVSVYVQGHTLKFAAAPLTVPESIELRPLAWFRVTAASPYVATPTGYRLRGIEDAGQGASLSVVPDIDGENSQPVVTFAAAEAAEGYRAVLRNVQEYRTATFTGARSAPVTTTGRTDFTLMSMSGQVDESWRGTTLSADVRGRIPSDLYHLRANLKVQAAIGFSRHDEADWGPLTYCTCYLTPPERVRSGGVWHTSGAMEAQDIIEARMAKKHVGFQCSFGGWTLTDAWSYAVAAAGVPPDLLLTGVHDGINYTAGIADTILAAGQVLPEGRPDAPAFAFDESTDWPSAIDVIVAAGQIASRYVPERTVGLEWGASRLGRLFLTPQWEWEVGTSDYTLDATATGRDMISEWRETLSFGDFRNLIYVIAGEGVEAAAAMFVDAQWSNAAARRFVGDLWSHFERLSDGASPQVRLVALWEEIARWHHLFQVELHDEPTLVPDTGIWPGHVFTADVAGTRAYDETLGATPGRFKVINKAWEVGNDGRFKQTLTGVRVDV